MNIRRGPAEPRSPALDVRSPSASDISVSILKPLYTYRFSYLRATLPSHIAMVRWANVTSISRHYNLCATIDHTPMVLASREGDAEPGCKSDGIARLAPETFHGQVESHNYVPEGFLANRFSPDNIVCSIVHVPSVFHFLLFFGKRSTFHGKEVKDGLSFFSTEV